MADGIQKQLEELGQYKHSYMSAKQRLDPLLEEAFQRLATLDTAIMHRVPGARLESVDDICELFVCLFISSFVIFCLFV